MSEKNPNLEWNVDVSDLSAISLDDESLNEIDEVLNTTSTESLETENFNIDSSNLDIQVQPSSQIDESVFLDSWDSVAPRKNVLKDDDNFSVYIRRFFASSALILLWIIAIVLFYCFNLYIKEASTPTPDSKRISYVEKFKGRYRKVRDMVWMENNHIAPNVWEEDEAQKVNEIINATDIDYIDKKDLLSKYASDLVRHTEDRATYAEELKQDVAKQWFLPEELEGLLSEDQAIDTIQRSLNALEVIKFSTATKVFSYMNTALATVSEMMRIWWASIENLHDLFVQLNSRWEKDISSYVYMCYLNPFEINANCDAVWDLDLYYSLAKDNSIDIRLFKNSMNAISQLLERNDTSLFSITFNGFNAKDKNIQFNIEVYTNQEDEKALMQQWKRNPNIFILTNIINLLKQSSFIIWADINVDKVTVNKRTLNQWGISRKVNYSTMDFAVPIQKWTEREIFDYIDLESMKKLLLNRWFKDDIEIINEELLTTEETNIDSEEFTGDTWEEIKTESDELNLDSDQTNFTGDTNE